MTVLKIEVKIKYEWIKLFYSKAYFYASTIILLSCITILVKREVKHWLSMYNIQARVPPKSLFPSNL